MMSHSVRHYVLPFLGLGALIVASFLIGDAMTVRAHPGRLNAEGCHKVVNRYEHKSGKVDEAGTEHCHRLKQGRPAILDGREQLSDPNHPDENSPRDDEELTDERQENRRTP